MTAKQYLRQLRRLDLIINAKLVQLDELRSLALKITPSPDPAGGGRKTNADRICGIVAKLIDLERDIDKAIDRLIDLKKEAAEMIDGLDDDLLRLVLTHRYINGRTWCEVAYELGCTPQWAHKLHARALAEFEQKYGAVLTVDRS